MTNVKSFKVNNIDASINIATDTEVGLMSADDHKTLSDISSGFNLNTSTGEEAIYPNDIINVVYNPEFIKTVTDNESRLLESTSIEGNKIFYTDVTINGELKGTTIDLLNSSIDAMSTNYTSSLLELRSDININSQLIDNLTDNIGNLTTLDTSIKTDLVSAINEVESNHIILDTTLTQTGSAADAEIVGDKLNELYLRINTVLKQMEYFGIGIDSSTGVLKIAGNMYKLTEYDGDVSVIEYIDAMSFVNSVDNIDNIEYQSVITDSTDKVLYGIYTDGSVTIIDFSGIIITNPSTDEEVSLSVLINALS